MKQIIDIHKQRGLAALVTAVVLLIVVTIVIIFSAKFGLQELRISANEARHKEAQQLADAALEQGASFIRANPSLYQGDDPGWVDCTGALAATFPCTVSLQSEGDISYDKAYGSVVGGVFVPFPLVDTALGDGSVSLTYILFDSNADGSVLTVVGHGVSKDTTARSGAKLDYGKIALVTPGEIPPVMAPELNLNGNFTIVANPNNGVGTTGVPISGWTALETSSGTGSWQTCHLGDYVENNVPCTDQYEAGDDWSGCLCTSSISNKDDIGYDIFEDPTGFPDPLTYIFGTDSVDFVRSTISSAGKYYAGDCVGLATLDLASLDKPWVFVEGDCDVPAVGTKDLPVVLVVNGQMKINATTDAWGLLVSITDVQSNGAAHIHGSLIADGTANIANGGYTQIYTPEVLENLTSEDLNTLLSKVPYSWTDLITNLPN